MQRKVVSFLLFALLGTSLNSFAQPQTAPLVVMNLAAHPDDEDGSTLAYYRHGRDAIAYSVIFTRGEGGQNEIGPELYEELGAVRTRETERAARHLGTQVYFLNFKDFGYSKSAEETFDRWGGKDEVTSRLVYLIRKLKPDVLFTNHDTVTVGSNVQHGHHQVVGIAAYEAFELASDPSYHPEQLDEPGVDLWQPDRLYRRLWRTDGSHDTAIPVADLDAESGVSYAAIAARALGEHASQGMDNFADWVADWDSTYFVQYRTATDAPTSRTDLAANLPPNREADPHVSYWIDSGRLSALDPSAISVSDKVLVPGQRFELSWTLDRLPARPIRLSLFGALDTTIVIRDDSPSTVRLTLNQAATPTIPKKVYQYERFQSHSPLGYAIYDARSGALTAGGYLNAEIAPPIYLEPTAEVQRLRSGRNAIPFEVQVFDEDIRSLTLSAAVSDDSRNDVIDQRQEQVDVRPNETVIDSVELMLPEDPAQGRYTVSLSAKAPGLAAVEKAFLPAQVFSVRVPDDLRVGVIESYDNTLAHALGELGVDYIMLDSTDLAERSLDDLHTIVVDIRAYLVRRDLRAHNDRLLDWVRAGGNLVVNYQKTLEWNADNVDPFVSSRNNPGNFAPYPITLSHDRVTRETAPVTVLMPDHPILNAPNPISEAAWEGWVQERGLYFPGSYDDRYRELFSVGDPGEEPLPSSTLFAEVGDGTYLYTALAWYRQLKEYHPGAYRIFANMISLPLIDRRTNTP